MADETATKETVDTTAKNQPTEKEMLAKRKEAIKNIEKDLPELRVQAEYEELITKIEIARFERIQISMQMAQMMAPPPGGANGNQPQERKLKVTE